VDHTHVANDYAIHLRLRESLFSAAHFNLPFNCPSRQLGRACEAQPARTEELEEERKTDTYEHCSREAVSDEMDSSRDLTGIVVPKSL
jgi:hypothetical protein